MAVEEGGNEAERQTQEGAVIVGGGSSNCLWYTELTELGYLARTRLEER